MSAQSPATGSANVGPNGQVSNPTGAPVANGVPGGNVNSGPSAPSAPPAGSTGQHMSQQNLNQIVIDYLAKKGYHKTEALLRVESSNQQVPPEAEINPKEMGPPKYLEYFGRLEQWTNDCLDIYKPEVVRFLWPVFIYCYLDLVDHLYSKDATMFFKKYQEQFRKEHEYDLRRFERITLAEHSKDDNIAKIYKDNKYRLMLSQPAFRYLMSYLESIPSKAFTDLLKLVEKHMDIREVERSSDERFTFQGIIDRARRNADMPLEDEGIPGHRPGNAVSSTDPSVGNNLATLKLGKLPMEKELEEDVRGDLMDIDLEVPPKPGLPTLVETHDRVNIKQEDEDEGPTRTEIPFPPSVARDVGVEVQKIREHRDRVQIEGRTGGVGPALSCVTYTFHNTADSLTCIDISGDTSLVAAGTCMSYIRVWSLDGSEIGPKDGDRPQSSQRLIGHSAPVYRVHFQPSSVRPPDTDANTGPEWLLSCAGDGEIRLWNLLLWQTVVVYKGHVGPVWDVQWGPFGHYFVSAGSDKTSRLWTTSTVQALRYFAGHDEDVDCVAWHPNAAYVFTASSDKTVRMWAVSNGNAVRMFTGHTCPITALACSRDGKLLASGDDQGNILLWDLTPGRLLKKMRGHGKGGIWSLSWGVESTVLVSGGADCTVRVWDVTGPAKEPTTKAGEPSKPGDAPATTVNLGQVTQPKKKGKEAVVTADQISAFATKMSPVYHVQVTNMNLILAGAAFLPENIVNK